MRPRACRRDRARVRTAPRTRPRVRSRRAAPRRDGRSRARRGSRWARAPAPTGCPRARPGSQRDGAPVLKLSGRVVARRARPAAVAAHAGIVEQHRAERCGRGEVGELVRRIRGKRRQLRQGQRCDPRAFRRRPRVPVEEPCRRADADCGSTDGGEQAVARVPHSSTLKVASSRPRLPSTRTVKVHHPVMENFTTSTR